MAHGLLTSNERNFARVHQEKITVPIVRFRLIGNDAQADAMITALHEIDDVDRVEEVADQMHGRDDTSSRGLNEDGIADFHCIEAHAADARSSDEVRGRVAAMAHEISAGVEFVDRF